MAITHNLGFPRIGPQRELKFATEAYWKGELDADALLQQVHRLRDHNTLIQAASGLDWVPCGDFALYDQVLDTSFLLGNIPERFRHQNPPISQLDQYFLVARGRSQAGQPAFASEMTKWFDTNYHYLVPEFEQNTHFCAHAEQLLEALRTGVQVLKDAPGKGIKPVLLGPLSYLWLGKHKTPTDERLALLETLLPVYQAVLSELHEAGAQWVQIDEPILALDLPEAWQQQFEPIYHRLQCKGLNLLLATYFGSVAHHAQLLTQLPVAGLHIDAVRGRDAVNPIVDLLPVHKVLSLGVIDGRNVWKSDLNGILDWLEPLHQSLGDRLWLAPSCSLLHVPVDLSLETELDPELKSWLAFARQKLAELNTLKTAINQGRESVADTLAANAEALAQRRQSARVHNPAVQQRCASIQPQDLKRALPYGQRAQYHQNRWQLPAFATTTIGSFPQTAEIRGSRRAYRLGQISEQQYRDDMREQIRYAVQQQEAIGLDVLVHGEAERNDMVEYFGEQLAGYGFTRFGWVQSYGSRCVKPPIIYGDVARPQAMTVEWSQFAQSLTEKPMKGMLTGPITLLQWAFVRDDQPRAQTARQIALALRDEVQDLEAAGIGIIQVDEPALREGLPLRHSQWAEYLEWAVQAFRLATASAQANTQIHTHMCYSEFNDIMPAIADLDADVITIETARSDMELLDVFTEFAYPYEIGPGVYDIHSPNVPALGQMVRLLERAAKHIPPERLWVNPDCGLKTRQWSEVVPALTAMVKAAQRLREQALATAV